MYGNQDHNLNAPPAVALHRCITGYAYSQQSGGQMDWWREQSPMIRRRFRMALKEAAQTAIKQGVTLEDLAAMPDNEE